MIYRDIRTKPTAIKSYLRLVPPYTFRPIDVAIAHARLVGETKPAVGLERRCGNALLTSRY